MSHTFCGLAYLQVVCRFDPDPTLRLNFYGVTFASALSFYGYYQIGVQRYCSLSSIRKARM